MIKKLLDNAFYKNAFKDFDTILIITLQKPLKLILKNYLTYLNIIAILNQVYFSSSLIQALLEYLIIFIPTQIIIMNYFLMKQLQYLRIEEWGDFALGNGDFSIDLNFFS